MPPRATVVVNATHPGTVIADRLASRGRTQLWLSQQVQVSDGFISRLLRGQNNLTAALALRLEAALGLSAQRLMRMQADYDLAEARAQALRQRFAEYA